MRGRQREIINGTYKHASSKDRLTAQDREDGLAGTFTLLLDAVVASCLSSNMPFNLVVLKLLYGNHFDQIETM